MRNNFTYADHRKYSVGKGKGLVSTGEQLLVRCYGEDDLERAAADILKTIGVPVHFKGYQYLKSGIVMGAKDPEIMNYLIKELYPAIAEHYHTGIRNVERTIRYAIEKAWSCGNQDELRAWFGTSNSDGDEKPTNKEFIALIADKLHMEFF